MTGYTDVPILVSYKKAFTVNTGLVSIAGVSEHDFLLLKNPSASAVKILMTHFSIGVDSNSVRSMFKIYANPTITNPETALTPVNTYIGDDVPVSKMEAHLDPTISARGLLLDPAIHPSDANSRGINRDYWMDPGHAILVTIENSLANADSFASIHWIENP